MWDFKGHITIWGQGDGFNSKGRGPHLLAEDQSPDNSVGPGQGHWALAFNLTPLVNIVLPRDDSTCLHTLRPTCPLDLEEQPPPPHTSEEICPQNCAVSVSGLYRKNQTTMGLETQVSVTIWRRGMLNSTPHRLCLCPQARGTQERWAQASRAQAVQFPPDFLRTSGACESGMKTLARPLPHSCKQERMVTLGRGLSADG